MTEEEIAQIKSSETGIKFKDFLERSTNLLTAFGILTALILFAQNLESSLLSTALNLCLYVLSVMVWWEIIIQSWRASDGSFKYQLFIFLSASIEIILILYLVNTYVELFFVLIILVCFYGLWFATSYIYVGLLGLYIKKTNNKRFINWLRTTPQASKKLAFIAFVLGLLTFATFVLVTGTTDKTNALLLKVLHSFFDQTPPTNQGDYF